MWFGLVWLGLILGGNREGIEGAASRYCAHGCVDLGVGLGDEGADAEAVGAEVL